MDPVYTRHVEKLWPESDTLFAAGERVEALVTTAGWADIQAVLSREIALIDRELDSARKPLEQADYALAHGRRDGLRGAQRAVDAIIRFADEQRERQENEAAGESAAVRS